MQVFKNLYQYRELLKTNVKKEIRGKYKGSFLGVLWSFVNPLLMVLVYAIVFPYIMRVQQDNYLIFLIVAIIPWNFFTTVVAQGSITVRTNANIIKKVYFPREILPISVVVSGLVNFLISCIIIFIFLIGSGIGLSWHLLLLPLIALIEFMLTLGIVFMVSSINIYIREIALQLRLRNLSGIIIIDFISQNTKEQDNDLLSYLSGLVKTDSVKTNVIDMTSLGLVEVTRKKIHKSLREQLKG